jgi:hypothetical protein
MRNIEAIRRAVKNNIIEPAVARDRVTFRYLEPRGLGRDAETGDEEKCEKRAELREHRASVPFQPEIGLKKSGEKGAL